MRIGIDLGGSHVGIGLIDESNNIIRKKEENLTEEEKANLETSLVEKIKRNTNELLDDSNLIMDNIEKIGIACPRNN